MSFVTMNDGTEIFYKDWGLGQPVVFSHGWPLNADSWESQMLFLASNGYRCVAHDRRGHGRSTQTWHGNEMDTYADDLATLIEALDLRDVVLVGFSKPATTRPDGFQRRRKCSRFARQYRRLCRTARADSSKELPCHHQHHHGGPPRLSSPQCSS